MRERIKGKYGNGCRGAIGGPVTKGSVEDIRRITVSQDGLHMELMYT